MSDPVQDIVAKVQEAQDAVRLSNARKARGDGANYRRDV